MPAQFCPTCKSTKMYPASDSGQVVCDTCGTITVQVHQHLHQHRPSRLRLLFLSEWMWFVLLLILLVGFFVILLLVPRAWRVNTFMFGFCGVVLLALMIAMVQMVLRRTTPAFTPKDRIGTNQALVLGDSPWAILLLNVLFYVGLTSMLFTLWMAALSWPVTIGTLSGGVAGLFSILILRRRQQPQVRDASMLTMAEVTQRVNWWFIPGAILMGNLLGSFLQRDWRAALLACLGSIVVLVWGYWLLAFYYTRIRQHN